ncbi:MAG: hypothetical protein ACFE85_00790 [Candidatus Hodarchaeota archaeon]
MIIKLKIKTAKKSKEKKLVVWIQKRKDFESEIQQLLQFFRDQISFTIKSRFFQYYKITSENPAIMISLMSTVQDLIAEIYFNEEESIEMKEHINL